MKILYRGPFGMRTGYARACHDYLMALRAAGAEISIDPVAPKIEYLEPHYRPLTEFVGRELDHDVLVVHCPPAPAPELVTDDDIENYNARRVCITTWETRDMPLPMQRSLLKVFDIVIVPSGFCAEAMPEVAPLIVPHAIDETAWPLKREDRREGQPYRFYSIGVWSDRKNFEGLLMAYFHTFTREDNVHLHIQTPRINEVAATVALKKTNIPEDQLPLFTIGDGWGDHKMLLELHHGGDCYVSTSRGEGWGLGAFEAMFVGNSVIMPAKAHGCVDALHRAPGEQFYEYRAEWTPVAPGDQVHLTTVRAGKKSLRVRSVSQHAPTGLDCRQAWVEPVLAGSGGLSAMLRGVAGRTNDEQHQLAARKSISDLCSYEAVGRQLMEALRS